MKSKIADVARLNKSRTEKKSPETATADAERAVRTITEELLKHGESLDTILQAVKMMTAIAPCASLLQRASECAFRLESDRVYTRHSLMAAMGIGRRVFDKMMAAGLPCNTEFGAQFFHGAKVIEFLFYRKGEEEPDV